MFLFILWWKLLGLFHHDVNIWQHFHNLSFSWFCKDFSSWRQNLIKLSFLMFLFILWWQMLGFFHHDFKIWQHFHILCFFLFCDWNCDEKCKDFSTRRQHFHFLCLSLFFDELFIFWCEGFSSRRQHLITSFISYVSLYFVITIFQHEVNIFQFNVKIKFSFLMFLFSSRRQHLIKFSA